MKISNLVESDYVGVWNLFSRVFDRLKEEDTFYSAWECREKELSFCFREENKVIAFILVRRETDTKHRIEFLAVDPDTQGSGIGTTLLHKVMSMCQSISLIPINDQRIIHWYMKNGFKLVSRSKDRWGDDQILLETSI